MTATEAREERGQRFRWDLMRRASAEQLRQLGELDPLLSQLLLNRGLADPTRARRFLAAELEPLADPSLMAGMDLALARLRGAIVANEQIAVYGDYDVDGLTATAVLCLVLRRLGARVTAF